MRSEAFLKIIFNEEQVGGFGQQAQSHLQSVHKLKIYNHLHKKNNKCTNFMEGWGLFFLFFLLKFTIY